MIPSIPTLATLWPPHPALRTSLGTEKQPKPSSLISYAFTLSITTTPAEFSTPLLLSALDICTQPSMTSSISSPGAHPQNHNLTLPFNYDLPSLSLLRSPLRHFCELQAYGYCLDHFSHLFPPSPFLSQYAGRPSLLPLPCGLSPVTKLLLQCHFLITPQHLLKPPLQLTH